MTFSGLNLNIIYPNLPNEEQNIAYVSVLFFSAWDNSLFD
jgi:hypothetical protein